MTTDLVETARARVEALVADVVQVVGAGGGSAADLQGVALYDTERDGVVTGQPTWEAAAVAVLELPRLQERFGREHVRLTLQLVYETFQGVGALDGWEARLAAVWRAFLDELNDPEWRWVGVTSLYGVMGVVAAPLDAEPFAVVPRQDLQDRGVPLATLQAIARDDLTNFGSNLRLVVEARMPKAPDAFMQPPQEVALAPLRALGALRLAAAGPFHLGRVFVARRSRFNVGDAGTLSMFGPGQWPSHLLSNPHGSLSKATVEQAAALFAQLRRLEAEGYTRAPGNLDLALRSFMLSYDAGPTAQEQRILHLITAAESLVGSEGGELTFKMCFRVSGLLAATDDERIAIFKRFKSFYDTRSKAVHGSPLKPRHRQDLADASVLEGYLRRLLRGWIKVATDDRPEAAEWRTLLDDKAVDETLLRDRDRQRTRAALGLESP